MKIYKFANILSLPFFLLLLYFIYRLVQDPHDMLVAWAIIPLASLILIYLFQPQIDYWWLSRNPVEIDQAILQMISGTNPYYLKLDAQEKAEFHKRLLLYVNGRAFSAKGMDTDSDVPYDIKYMIAQVPVSLSFRNKDFLLKNYDRIILYKHAFPSPLHRFLHTSEINTEDGVIIFSLEHAEAAFFKPEQFYNVAWHSYAEAYLALRKPSYTLADESANWDKVERISGFTRKFILDTLGFESTDIRAVALVCYFLYPVRFADIWPEENMQIQKFLSSGT